jgi:hypothetical protein
MLGLQRSLTHQATDMVTDIHQLLEQSFAQYGGAAALPYTEVVRAISTFQPRNRG